MTVEVERQPVRRFLPLQPNALVGRAQTVAMARAALLRSDCHLLTLLGPGGIGKTRLALSVAETVADEFQNGVSYVDLTQVNDAAAVPSLLAAQLGLQADNRSPLERVMYYLADRQVLLVLDNCEHVLPIALLVADLLQGCTALTILATSRNPLRLRWEERLVVSPLELPDPNRLPPPDETRAIPAVALFLQRARAVEQPIDDWPGKPVHIWTRTGRKPLLAGGNADSDAAMLETTRFGLLVHHDAKRESASDAGAEQALEEAARRSWTVVSMKDDWAQVF